MKLNNLNLNKANTFVEEVKADKSKAIKVKKVEGHGVYCLTNPIKLDVEVNKN